MKKELIEKLTQMGLDQRAITDMLLYELVTDDRRKEMLSWLEKNGESADRQQVAEKAREIAESYLKSLPYNKCNLSQEVPKYEAAVPKEQPAEIPKVEEAPFDIVLQTFFGKS